MNAQKMGFGVVGAGILGEEHSLVYSHMPESELVAVCDVNGERARAVAEKFGARQWYTNYHELVKSPDIQAVSIATPDHLHTDIAIAAAQAGKHILIEKPLATSLAEAEKIEAAVKQAGVKFMVDYQNRTNPPFVSAKKSVEAGEIGTPAYGYIRLSNTTWVPMEMIPWGSKTSSLWFLAIHTIDVMRWLLQDEIMRVYAVSRSGILRSLGVDTQDFHCAIGEFKNGAVVTFENVWILPRSQPMVPTSRWVAGQQGQINVNTSHHCGGEASRQDGLRRCLWHHPHCPQRLGSFVKKRCTVHGRRRTAPVLATLEDGMADVRRRCHPPVGGFGSTGRL
jgi:predicted dehydrogenase